MFSYYVFRPTRFSFDERGVHGYLSPGFVTLPPPRAFPLLPSEDILLAAPAFASSSFSAPSPYLPLPSVSDPFTHSLLTRSGWAVTVSNSLVMQCFDLCSFFPLALPVAATSKSAVTAAKRRRRASLEDDEFLGQGDVAAALAAAANRPPGIRLDVRHDASPSKPLACVHWLIPGLLIPCTPFHFLFWQCSILIFFVLLG